MLHTLTAREINEKFLKKELKATEIVQAYLKRIENLEPKVDAFLSLCPDRALKVAEELDIDFSKVDRREFARGMIVELEHGTENPATDVTGDDPILTAKIALAHLNELPDYYTLLDEMEEEASEEMEE